jgi:hypothetical protein
MKVEVDVSEVQKMLAGINRDILKTAIPKAVDQTAKQTQRSMVVDASRYSVVTEKTKGRWKWQTYGRIPRAITISKLFKRNKSGFSAKDGDRGRKVFIQRRKGAPESRRAVHWNLVVHGFKQWIPTGQKAPSRPNKAGLYTRRSKLNPVKPPHPMFNATAAKTLPLLKSNLVHQLKLAFKKNSQQ